MAKSNNAQKRIWEDDPDFTILPPKEKEPKRAKATIRLKGGPGSGHHGHAGRKGKRGGSEPGVGFASGTVPDGTGLTEDGKDVRLESFFNSTVRLLYESTGKSADPVTWAHYEEAVKAGYSPGSVEFEKWLEDEVAAGRFPEDKIGDLRHYMSLYDSSWSSASYSDRGAVKNKLVTDISEATGLPYHEVNAAIKQWSHTSNDSSPESLSLQKAVSDEFGVALSPWQQSKIAVHGAEPGYTPAASFNNWTAAQRQQFVRAMYTNTQQKLREAGFGPNDKVTLYRGYDPGSGQKFPTGKTIQYNGNAAESWSLSPRVAGQFGTGGIVIETQVEVRSILGTALTGWGCLTEGEIVMFGSTGHEARVYRGNASN